MAEVLQEQNQEISSDFNYKITIMKKLNMI